MTASIVALLLFVSLPPPSAEPLTWDGSSPQLAVDASGTVRMVFGKADTIFCVTSTDRGATFSRPVIVAVVAGMHLGNTRGPVIASSARRSLVAAGDKSGDIHLFSLDHGGNTWRSLARPLNDVPGSAPEGLVTLAADDENGFHATWLDLRGDRKNQVFFSRTRGSLTSWTANTPVYSVVDQAACECCRPSIAVSGRRVAVMFRNSRDGFRDMYLAESADGGSTFAAPRKLGSGSWKLDACPMDGGAIAFDGAGRITTIWRRDDSLFTARPGERETPLGRGRSPQLTARGTEMWMTWQLGASVVFRRDGQPDLTSLGDGRLPQVIAVSTGVVLAAWESRGKVYMRRIP